MFEDGDIVATPQQVSAEITEPRTEVRLTTENFHLGFNRMIFEHENRKKKSKIRTYGDTAFNEYIPQNSFLGFYNNDHKLLILQTSKKNANEATKRLKKYFSDKFKVQHGEVDFAHVVQRVPNVWGGWIGRLNLGNLKSAGLFGDHVNLSEDFDRLKAAGSISCLNVELDFEQASLDFMITKQRGVVFLQNFEDEQVLNMIMQLRPLLYES